MNEEIQNLLKRASKQEASSHERQIALDEIKSLSLEIERLIDNPVILDDQIQVAGHFATLSSEKELPSPVPPNKPRSYLIFAATFSRYGKLFTIERDNRRAVKEAAQLLLSNETISIIRDKISSRGFIFVPDEVLDETAGWEKAPDVTWRYFFFEYW